MKISKGILLLLEVGFPPQIHYYYFHKYLALLWLDLNPAPSQSAIVFLLHCLSAAMIQQKRSLN